MDTANTYKSLDELKRKQYIKWMFKIAVITKNKEQFYLLTENYFDIIPVSALKYYLINKFETLDPAKLYSIKQSTLATIRDFNIISKVLPHLPINLNLTHDQIRDIYGEEH